MTGKANQPLEVRDTTAGAVLNVRAQPKASRDAVIGLHAGALKVAVTEPPERGKANRSIEAVIADWIGVPKSGVSVIQGETSRNKVVQISGKTAADLLLRIQQD